MAKRSTLVFIDIERVSDEPSFQPMEYAAVAVESGTYREIASIDCKVHFNASEANPKYLGAGKYSPTVWEQYAIDELDAATKLSVFLQRYATPILMGSAKKPIRLAKLAAHNIMFDTSSIEAWFERLEVPFPALRLSLCTMQLALWFVEHHQEISPPFDYQLGTLAYFFSLPTVPDHTALADTRTAVELARTISRYQNSRVTSAA